MMCIYLATAGLTIAGLFPYDFYAVACIGTHTLLKNAAQIVTADRGPKPTLAPRSLTKLHLELRNANVVRSYREFIIQP